MALEHKILIVGGGIAGVCLGLRALDLGFSVTLISHRSPEVTASGIAAGMIAPACEAFGEDDPLRAFDRLRAAEAVWPEFLSDMGLPGLREQARPTLMVMRAEAVDQAEARFKSMGARCEIQTAETACDLGLEAGYHALSLRGDWMLEAGAVLAYFKDTFCGRGGQWWTAQVAEAGPDHLTLTSGETLEGGHVVLAGGFGTGAFVDAIPGLSALKAIKGHILDIPAEVPERLRGQVIRFGQRYMVGLSDRVRFGASMQTDVYNESVEAAQVDALCDEACRILPQGIRADIGAVKAQAGLRAATPDGWPWIGRDRESRIWVLTGLRRNGWLMGPWAAQVLMGQITGASPITGAGADPYDPQRDFIPR